MNHKSTWDNATLFQKLTFSVANQMINTGLTRPLEMEDLAPIPQSDSATKLLQLLKIYYEDSQPLFGIPRLVIAMIKTTWNIFIIVATSLVLEGVVKISLPIALIFMLRALQDPTKTSEQYLWAMTISILSMLIGLAHHVTFFYSMRMGWNWKNAATALIHEYLFLLNKSTLQNSGTDSGKMVNLISNDVARFEEFGMYIHCAWESLLELIAVLVVLIIILNPASGFAGVGSTIISISITLYFSKKFATYRGQTAFATDERVRHISEVINGIASVKSFAWENPFYQLIRQLREIETNFIAKSQVLKAMNQGFMYSSPALVSFSTFSVFWATGGILTIPIIFATVALLLTLRVSIGLIWNRSIETTSEALASTERIEAFLSLCINTSSTNPATAASEQSMDKTQASDFKDNNLLLQLRSSSFSYPVAAHEVTIEVSATTPEAKDPSSSSNDGAAVLQDIALKVHRGEILMIVGPVGSGKSTLLSALLGELTPIDDSDKKLSLHPGIRIAYCAQQPWILAASVKSNIALAGNIPPPHADESLSDVKSDFKHPIIWNEELYAKAVEKCCIVEDLLQWPAYDDTEVGERGVSVSGGQKARISLARAVYSDADHDPLSAVDAHVGKALFFDCIYEMLRNRSKGVVLVTHQLQYCKYADQILVLNKNGQQIFCGTYYQLLESNDVKELLQLNDSAMEGIHNEPSNRDNPMQMVEPNQNRLKYNKDYRMNLVKSLESSTGENNTEFLSPTIGSIRELKKSKSSKVINGFRANFSMKDGKSTATSMRIIEHQLQNETEEDAKRREIIESEDKAQGVIPMSVYTEYFSAGGKLDGSWALLTLVISQALIMIQQYWVRWWATNQFFDGQGDTRYIIIFGVLTIVAVFLGFYRAFSWFQYTLRAASKMHENCLWAVLHSPLMFFIANPTGRILNRFAKDQNQVDEQLPVVMFEFLQTAMFCFSAVILMCVTIPWLILSVPVLLMIFSWIRNKYSISTREIKRWEAVTRSPIYADFSATLDGLVTLRAYCLESRVRDLFQNQLDQNGTAWFSYALAVRWLGFRLDIESSFIVVFICFLSVILRPQIDVGLVGFALVYTLQLSGLFQWAVRLSAEAEAQMTSVERIFSYCALPPEPGYRTKFEDVQNLKEMTIVSSSSSHLDQSLKNKDVTHHQYETIAITTEVLKDLESLERVDHMTDHGEMNSLDASLSNRGHVVLKDVTVKYRLNLDPVLKSLSIDIPAGSKVGICGRTGSGKSSTLLALLRLNIIVEGDIFIDDQSLLKMDLESARSLVAIIPQEPHLFSGSIRFNMDPFSLYSDEQIWDALNDAHIKSYIITQPTSGLTMMVEEGGKNFSVGQRQLLSLARAILRRCKVILMDEVTASIDFVTDRLIQDTIRTSSALKNSTIITVAHRLRTIADSDYIAVIEKGTLVEWDTPWNLLKSNSTTSYFKKLAEESNELEDILQIANKKQSC